MKRIAFSASALVLTGCVTAQVPPDPSPILAPAKPPAVSTPAVGFVYSDENRNGVRDPDEPGISGVAVSNGLDVVVTDENGHYQLAVSADTVLFAIKPRNRPHRNPLLQRSRQPRHRLRGQQRLRIR